ncbi:MAG: homoserine O-acetyltransferase [Gammaproteobacteria bacterium]|nr:homoserine O-acetyltransferase [Gammaproteobacteria bacterium]|tara:strand:- start:1275 stop:2408 length:1134 start_codon:yes stop_codon:yes gene_type:complete
MLDESNEESVGIVKPQVARFSNRLDLDCGKSISDISLTYETYGKLNKNKDNAILICHALSGDHHAAGYHSKEDKKPGWWDVCIGPGKPFDTNKFFVVCPNNLGGCRGSTGPNTINKETGKLYGPDFPIVTVNDWVNSQLMLADNLGIDEWACVIGGSLGGMQALQWTISYPNRIKNVIAIAAAAKLSAQNIAFNEVARQSIITDPDFHQGFYYDYNTVPKRGLSIARMLGHITYLSDDSMRTKFGRDLKEGKLNFGYDVDFQVESYLRYQGQSFVDKFDANTYLLMTKALDYFDPASNFDGDLSKSFKESKSRYLILSFSSDWRFSSARSHEIVKALLSASKDVSYAEIEADQGHDAFLMPVPEYLSILKNFMDKIL